MDYKEEQHGEIEALESIYYGDLKIISSEPFYKFSIEIKSEEYNAEEQNGLSCSIIFTFVDKYPDKPPLIELDDVVNLSEKNENELLDFLKKQAEENLGMVMIFSLVSAAQEWLNVQWDAIKKQQQEEQLIREKEKEEAERKKFEGTRVTVESFLKWKQAFEEELQIDKKREMSKKIGKLTGRELFITDKTLNESDLKFLEGEEVKVDESLFQDLDDLDINDEDDEDDPDFDPSNYNSDDSS
ncbi:RWD domain-containing protein 1 [Agrilus planipennis]|uniref:RWD domain-containing protein 1 n=1 Tax=Agrilus planipennis TaxID=224129 RepID=A0A1W4WE68_AGRPL|nr:RWD domain-containing protein 1 [Agrilus planipennis]